MTYTLHGDPAWIVTLLAVLGALHIGTGIQDWLHERVSLDLHPLWHVIPRRFKVSIRWDRPGAYVTLPDGEGRREGCILYLLEHDAAETPIVLVQPCDEDDDPDLQRPGWYPLSSLLPLPGHSFRETWHAMRSKESA